MPRGLLLSAGYRSSKGLFALHDNDVTTMCFFCRHVRTVTSVTMQLISDDIKNYAHEIKILCHCYQVRTDPMLGSAYLHYTCAHRRAAAYSHMVNAI